ncbi:hypothetical protein PF004_g24834 [Phytophthora fragariae]|uniref:No apical meristem-associated C-terminal domain-containing protein n=1 Tax=Phytophthora fragariae TaxID=53985 RepID=A0A6G0MTT8_9STRA|nr:hypothetical protein PF004_g24834 [Phytophthora fragariae]
MSPASQASQATVSPTQVPTLDVAQSSLASSASPRPPASLELARHALALLSTSLLSASSTNRESETEEGAIELHETIEGEGSMLEREFGVTSATRKKGKNFGPDEDLNLAAAWLDVSQDPVVGDEQKKEAFWEKVHGGFVERMTRAGIDSANEQRVASSLQTRWRTLQETCNKFAGCYATIYACNESGKSVDDKILDAHVLYREQNKASFKSQAVWSILRHSPK